jgi:xanthine dehydrogenase accessory factor
VVGENATPAQFPRADRIVEFEVEALRFTPQTYVVVASHGNYDEPALEAALNSEAAYVALVASQKRRDSVLEYLRQSGLPDEKLARLKCPAGLNLGAVTPEEIALSILAEMSNSGAGQFQTSDLRHNPRSVESIDPTAG